MSKLEEMRKLREAERIELLNDKEQNPELYNSDLRDNIAYDSAIYRGEIAPKNDGVIGEAADAFNQSIISTAKGVGNTLEKVGLGSDTKDYFEGVLRRNRQWDAPENQNALSYVGRAVGSAAGSTAGTLAAGALGSLIAPGVGTAAGLTVGFMQTFGDNVDRNRKAGYSEDKAYGMAFLESAVDTAIEHAPFGIIGKGTKNTYRAARAAVKGKGALLKSLGKQTSLASKVGKKLVQKVGKDTAENLLLRWGKSAAMDGLGEAGEEAFQYLNSYLNQKLGGDPNAEFSLDELADSIAQGFIGGFFLQVGRSAPGVAAEAYRKRQRANAGADTAGTDIPTSATENVPEYTMPQNSTASNIALAANDSEAQIISTIDNMSDEAVRAAVGRLNMPGVEDVANTPIEILRKNYIDYEINKEREAVRETAAASPAPVAPATPVSGENSISRETLTPEAAPIVAPEVASAPVAPVNTPAPAASPVNIPVAETASVETPANDIPEYTMQSALEDASIDYQLQKPVVSDAAVIDNGENLNTDVDVVSSDTAQDLSTPTADIEPLSFSEASKAKDKRAAEQYEKKAYEQLNKKIKIDLFDTETVKDKDLRQTLAAAKRIFHALGMGKLVTVEQVGNEPLFLGVTDTENEETRKRVLLDVKGHKGNNALLFHTAMHELVHNLIANNQKAYQKLKKAVIDKIYDRDYYNELFDNYAMNRRFDLAEITETQQATIEEEFICDTVADLMQTEKFWEILAAEDMTLAQKFLKALKDLLAKITSGNQNNIPKTQQIFQNNLNDVISLAQQFVIESSKKDISSLIRAKNKTETTATAEPSVPVSTTPSTSDLAKRMHSAIESGKKLHQFSQKQLDDVFDFLIDNESNDAILGEIDANKLMSEITIESESRDETVILDNVDKITDEDFNNPFRNIVLPALPQKLLNLIGKKSKPVLLKKNILDKNKEHHPDLSAEDNRKILDAALYHAEEIINDKPSAKPNYWVLAKIDGKSSIVTIEISETKDAHEIVGWHFANEKAMDKIRNRANREGGQVLITKSNAQGSSDLYDLPADTTNTIPQSPEKSSAEDKKTPTPSDKIRKKPEPSDQSESSDRQTFSDKFRAKEKEITGVNNPNIIIAESTPQGLKSVEKGDTLKETETSAKTITEDKSNDQRTLGGNTGLSSDTNASASHDGVSETTSDRTAGEKGTGGVSGSDVQKSDGIASAGKSSVAAESGLRNSDGDGSTAGGSGEQKTGEVVSRGNQPAVRDVERASSARVRSGESASAVKKLNANNFRITPDTNLVPAGDVSKTQANIEAIKLIKTLDKENRQATAEEKQILAKYTGWGGLSNVFYPGGRFYSELKSLLTQKEFQDAQASTINAHYTERGVISAMWDVASHLGFKGGKVGEFGAGVGHFLGLIPDKLFNKTAFKAVELDTISGKILQYLYPGADVTIDGLEHVKIANNSLDMVIGNFPFAKEGPFDRNYPKFNLHNYFFARAIDAVKPGGLVVALTSNSTLDSINQDARKYFAERADFVGAIRLPNNAFKKNAGTEVVTDIIVFRKHDGTESNLAENKVPFLRSVAVDGVTNDENNIRVNEYFVNAHPDMVMGKITSQGSMYRGDSMTVEATTEPDKLPGLIEKALKKLPKDIMGAEKIEIVADTADMVLTDEQKKALREGEVFVDKLGTPMIYQDGKGVLFTKATDKKLSQNEIKKIQSFVKLKETYNSLMETMRSDASDAEVKKQQQQLNKIYDEHVKKFGYLSERRKYTNLVNDPGYLRMSALENKETITDPDNPKIKKTVYKKSDVFTLRTIKKAVIPTHADNASDAAIISINYTGKLDFQFMEKLTGKPAEQIKSELLSGGNFFVDPASGLLVEKEEYLSGNIAQKIFEVEQQITENPELSTNLEALKAVLPQPKEIGKISFNLGATWIPAKVIEKWIKSVYNVTAKIRYSEKNDLDGASAWKVEISNPELVTQFNIGNRDIEDLIEDSLNLRRTKVYGRDSDGKPYLDKEKTQTANSLQEELKRSFVDFVRTDSESATAVEKVYNETFNVFVERKIDPAKCLDVYPGASDTINGKPFRLRDHQKAVVSRCIRGNTLIAHCVGAGKTVEMITANMELIRLGLASKGLILVQKSTLGQFAEEAQQLYPNARTLAADAKSMEKKNRRRFLSKIANGSWDMVIMPHPSFDNLLLSPELQRQQIEDAISEVVEAINEQKAERNSRLTIKELERKKKALTAKLEKLQSRVNEEDTFYFDELGFDAIFVDEAHNYKKLDFHTKLGNIKGLDKSGSSRAFNMKGKLDFIRSKTGGRNIYFATGTPVTNTLAEVWNMIRFVSPETLEEFNVRTFDQFAATFTATVNAIEQNAAGNWKAVERFSEFTNIEELHKFVSSIMDIILPEDLKGVKRPTLKNGKPTYVTSDRTEELTRFVEQLKELYEAFDAASGAEKREYSAIPLMIYGLAKKASIDMRLINDSFPDDPNSKLNAVVENAFSRYKELSDIKGTQAIFCDMYRNVDKKTGSETFNVYKELKRKLVEKGVPESEIAIINDYTTDSAKEKLFELVNAGEVRFVMGSTQKLGTGVNIQERLAALHHIDAPPRPSDMEQRDGRIIRQGNTISEPEILCYAVDKTLDSFSYAMLARKAKFINMALKGKANESGNLEVTDDDVIDYAAFSAETSGDKRAVRYVELNKRADELENAKRRYQKNVYDADGNIERYTKSLNTAEKDIKSLTEFIEKYGKFDLKTAPVSLNGRTLTGERGEILNQLDKQVFDRLTSGFGSAEISIGDLGIRIKAEIEYQVSKPAETKITYTLTGLEVSSASGVAVSGNANTAQGLMQSLGAMLKKKSSELDMLKEKAKSYEGLIEQQKKIKNSKFEFADELDEVIKERDELKNTLANEAAEKGKDKKHLTLPQAAAMLGLSSEDFLIEDEDTDSDLKLSEPGDRADNSTWNAMRKVAEERGWLEDFDSLDKSSSMSGIIADMEWIWGKTDTAQFLKDAGISAPGGRITDEQRITILEAYDYAMNGDPVIELSGNEFQKDGIPLTKKVTEYYNKQFNGIAVHPELGEVKLDLEGVKDSLGHGIGKIKAAAYAAVPYLIEKGKIFNRENNWKNRGYDTVVMIAPLKINGIDYVGEVVVEQRPNRQGFYLHEVEIKEKLADVFKTPTQGGTSPVSKLIISQWLAKVNPALEKNPEKTSGELKLSIPNVWTGSAADYDKPSLHYIGSGEGSQVYGWGLYGSSSQSVGVHYAKADAARKAKSTAAIRFYGTLYSVEDLYSADQSDSDVRMLIEVHKNQGVQQAINALSAEIDRMKKNGYHPDHYAEKEYILKELLESKDKIEYLGDPLDGKRNLYRQTFFAGKEENLLDWDELISADQRKQIKETWDKEKLPYSDPVKKMFFERVPYGSTAYGIIEKALGSPKAASEFLYRAGIDGITYIGDSSGVRNYVAFSDEDIRVDEHIKFSMPGDFGDTSLDPVDYRRSIDPLFDFFMEYSDNGILNPGSAHIGEDFSGTFISPEFVAFSVKRKQGKNESDATYRKYLERRQNALENASGASLDTMAKEYVEKFGGDETEVAEKFLDMLRHLSKKDLISERAEAKREEKEAADQQRKADEAEWQKQKAETLRKKVDELFKAAKPVVDKRWIQINRQIYTALFKTVFPDAQTIPDIPSDREMRILNMVLENGNMSEAALLAEPYYTDKDKVLKDKLDKAQAETLTEFILRSRGGKGFLGLFHDINGKPDINLLEYAIMTPMWIAKKFAGTVVESIYKAARMMIDDKNRIMRYLSGDAFEKLMQLRKQDKAMYDKLNAYILKCDRDQTGAGKVKGNKEQTEFTATTADGEVIGKFDNEETAWDALFKREQESLVDNGYSKLAAESLYEIRSAMRRTFVFRLNSTIQYLRQAGLIDAKSTSFIIRDPEQFFPGEDIPANQEIDLFELMREMGQRSGYYMPRIRHGKYMLRATKAGHPVILKGFDSKAARVKEILKLRKDGYQTENFLANSPDQDMLGQLNPAALSDILNQAMERAKDVFSKDINIDETSYVTKDGKTVPQLAVTSKMKLSYAVTNTLKKLGGRYYDGAWRFDNFTPETKTKLKEIIESEVTNEVKSAMVMQSVIGSSIVDMIRENSSGSSKIARRTAVGDEVVQGYEEDVLRAYGLYIGGVSGASARNVMAKKMYAAFGGMDFDREEYINSLIPENLEKGTPEYQEALLNATTEYFKEVHRRALNSAKSPRIAKYMDKYIKDMLRNSTSLDRVLGAAKGISAVWMLNKPSSAINNLFGAIGLVPAVIDTETKCGISFALGNMLSGLNKYIKYAAYNKWGLGKPLTGVDSRIFDIIHKNGWDGAEMVADATKAGLTFADSKYQAFSNFMLGMFSMVESGNRASSIYAAAMALAKKRGVNLSAMNDVQLQDFLLEAVKISDFGNGVYDKTNKLTWARGGDWQSVIDSALLFKTYEVNYYNNMWNMFNHKNLKGLLYTTFSILAMGGGKASIPVIASLWALAALGITDPDDEEESDEYVYNLIADVAGQGTANVAKYGIPSLLGINLSGTYRDTITDALHDGVPDGTISISDLPAYSIFKRYENMKEYGFRQPGKMVEEILPAWFASGSRAIREKYTGVTDRAGRQRKDVNNEYIKPDTADFWLRIFGFNPVSISEKTDRIWTEKKVKEKYAEQRREIYSRYRDYMKSGSVSDSKLAQLALDIEEYNAKVARSNRNIPLIDEAGLNRAVKDTDSKYLKSSLDEKAQQRREKKEKGKIVIRNGKLVREEE